MPTDGILAQLVTHAAQLSGCAAAVLLCDSNVIARTGPISALLHVLASEGFLADHRRYELQVLDAAERTLTAHQAFAVKVLAMHGVQRIEGMPGNAELRRAFNERLVVSLDFIADNYLLLSSDWRIEHVNVVFERLVGRKREEIVGRNFWTTFPENLGTPFESEARAALSSGEARCFDGHRSPSGLWLHTRIFPCEEGLTVLMIDITERRKEAQARADQEQKVLQAQRMESLGTLASGIAHDFNNILGAVLGHVGLLKEQLAPGSEPRQSVDQIGVAGARARELVARILAFSRLSTRDFVAQPLRPLVEESLTLLRAGLPASVQIASALTTEPVMATANPSEVQQVLLNLCTNAWHALPAGQGLIEVRLNKVVVAEGQLADVGQLAPGDYALIEVQDNGAGMGVETRRRLFEPFFTTKPRGHGTGLGLHIIASMVTVHGGAVVVRSRAGEGSCFSVYLPVSTQGPPSVAAQAAQPKAMARGQHVVYLDDDEVLLLMVHRMLERAGYRVTTFNAPQDLLAAMHSGVLRFDALVTDHSMPGMTGIDVARAVKALLPAVPVIISTGFISQELEDEAARVGVTGIINKERTYEELELLLSRAFT